VVEICGDFEGGGEVEGVDSWWVIVDGGKGCRALSLEFE